MFRINGENIELTAGNTADLIITPYDNDEIVTLEEGDKVIFTVSAGEDDFIRKVLTLDNYEEGELVLHLTPDDTAEMPPGQYAYDCMIVFASGEAYTFIGKANFTLLQAISEAEE